MEIRQKMSRNMTANSVIPRIRVWPADEDNRRNIVHPSGIRFRETVNDSVEWPFDTFTKRRLRDGSVFDKAPMAAEPAVEAAPMEAAPVEAAPVEVAVPAAPVTEEVSTEEAPTGAPVGPPRRSKKDTTVTE